MLSLFWLGTIHAKETRDSTYTIYVRLQRTYRSSLEDEVFGGTIHMLTTSQHLNHNAARSFLKPKCSFLAPTNVDLKLFGCCTIAPGSAVLNVLTAICEDLQHRYGGSLLRPRCGQVCCYASRSGCSGCSGHHRFWIQQAQLLFMCRIMMGMSRTARLFVF